MWNEDDDFDGVLGYADQGEDDENEAAHGSHREGAPFEGMAELRQADFQGPGDKPKEPGEPWLEPQPPWHMWGTSDVLRIDSTGRDPDFPAFATVQLSRVSYRRPDTFCFWFGARLRGQQPYVSAAFVAVLFDVYIGLGRSNFQTGPEPVPVGVLPVPSFGKNAFCKFVFDVPLGQIGDVQPFKWTTTVPSPRLDDRTPEGDNTVLPMSQLVAQDIQCSATLVVLPLLIPTPQVYELEAHAYFAPRSHMRPDWFQKNPPPRGPHAGLLFRGKETGGT